MESNGTQAFIVIQDGTVLHENYYNDAQRDSIVTSFSVAKSFDSALIGKAIEEGFSNCVDDPIKTSLDDGDILLFYTDGVIEAQNINEEFFGEDRLMELSGSHNKSAEEIQVHIIGNLQSFVGEADPFADITLLTVKRE